MTEVYFPVLHRLFLKKIEDHIDRTLVQKLTSKRQTDFFREE